MQDERDFLKESLDNTVAENNKLSQEYDELNRDHQTLIEGFRQMEQDFNTLKPEHYQFSETIV